jgi:pSer/pThr/pTyr-binding forkhead associated (FHA) protein
MPELHLTPFLIADQGRHTEVPTIAIQRLPCVLGRASACDQRLDDPMVSRRHCAFLWRGGQVWVEDLASRNGTRLDGEPVLAPRPVADGAMLQVAHLSFTVHLEGFPAQPRLQPAGSRERGHGRE